MSGEFIQKDMKDSGVNNEDRTFLGKWEVVGLFYKCLTINSKRSQNDKKTNPRRFPGNTATRFDTELIHL